MMCINENAERLIEELKALPLLSRCGVGITGGAAANWNDAVVACGSDEWETVQNKMANEVRDAVAVVEKENYNKWNEYVSALRPVVDDLVQEAVGRAPVSDSQRTTLAQSMTWDLTLVLMGAIYRLAGLGINDVRSCYLEGRFPCAWVGEYPKGGLMKY
jgi:hypothetical protein